MQHLREQAGTEKGLLAQLAASTAVHLEPGGHYTLLPRPWLATWRAYIGASGKRSNMADVTRAGPLPEAVAETFCPCHVFLTEQPQNPVHLNIPPPSVVKRYGWPELLTQTCGLVARRKQSGRAWRILACTIWPFYFANPGSLA